MRISHFLSLLLIEIIIFLPQQSPLFASSDTSTGSVTFYGIGADDIKATASEKLAALGFDCGTAKSGYLGIRTIQDRTPSLKSNEKIRELASIDDDLKEFGKGLDYEEKPINVLVCSPLKDNPFKSSIYFFSKFDQKILAIQTEIEKIEPVKERLTSKFGECISKGYCENNESILILSRHGAWSLNIFFFENIKSHYKNLKNLKAEKDKKQNEQLNKAF